MKERITRTPSRLYIGFANVIIPLLGGCSSSRFSQENGEHLFPWSAERAETESHPMFRKRTICGRMVVLFLVVFFVFFFAFLFRGGLK